MTINPPDPGEVRLFDRVEPPLRQGKYQIDLTQSLPYLPQLNTADKDLSFTRYVEVVGQRWSVDPLTIHQRLPPKNEQGVLVDSSIPKIVFQRKTLPWERVSDDDDDNVPWMALLLIREDEMEDYCNLHLVEKGDGVLVSSLVSPSDPDANLRVDALEITSKLLNVIGPQRDELPLLAHALEVNPLDKELCGSDEDGWFSVVLSNRIPAKADTKYFACLVSLDDGKIDLFNSASGTYVIPVDTPNYNSDSESVTATYVPDDIELSLQVEDALTDGPLPDVDNPPGLVPDQRAGLPEFDDEELTNLDVLENSLETEDSSGQNHSGGGPLDLLLALPSFPFFRRNKSKQSEEKVTNTEQNKREISSAASMNVDMKENLDTLHHMEEIFSVASQISAHDYTGPTVHLPLLHYWTFKTGDGGDFESRMRNLRVRSREDDSDSVGDLGSLSDMIERTGSDYEPALLGNDMDPDVSVNSFLMTDIVCDDGITRPCLYRGPCIGVQLDREPKEKPYANSDEAAGIEIGTGIEEISHSSAFELGRLLGLSDPNFIRSVSRWRRLRYRKKATISNQTELMDKFPQLDPDNIESGEAFELKLVEMTLKDNYCTLPEVQEVMELKREVCGTEVDPADLGLRLQPESVGQESLPADAEMVGRYGDVVRNQVSVEFREPRGGDF